MSHGQHADPLRHRGPNRAEMLAILGGTTTMVFFLVMALPLGLWVR